jgi:hypothetical protein
MSSLIVSPYGHVRGASVGSLFGVYMARIQAGVGRVVRSSFDSHPVRHLTDAKIKERIDFCIAKAAELHHVMKWSSERIIDELPAALKAHLDGTNWEPSKRASWAGSDDTQ